MRFSDIDRHTRNSVETSKVSDDFEMSEGYSTGNSTEPASCRVANTFELLQEILLHLSMRDSLFAQRVNKLFKSTIDISAPLQRTLYFLADECRNEVDRTALPVLNPMFNENLFSTTWFFSRTGTAPFF